MNKAFLTLASTQSNRLSCAHRFDAAKRLILAGAFVLAWGGAPQLVLAQVQASSQFGTTVNASGSDYTVTGGTPAGQKLLHGFSSFNVPASGSVTFDGSGLTPGRFRQIFGVINSGSASTLDGRLGVVNFGGAAPSIYLMNPHGFIVGTGFSTTNVHNLGLFAVDRLLLNCRTSALCATVSASNSFQALDASTTASDVNTLAWTGNANNDGAMFGNEFRGVDSVVSTGQSIQINATNLVLDELNLVASSIRFAPGSNVSLRRLNSFAQWFSGAAISSTGDVSNLDYGSFSAGSASSGLFFSSSSISAVGGSNSTANMLTTTQALYTYNGTSGTSYTTPGTISFAGVIRPNASTGSESATLTLAAQRAYLSEVQQSGVSGSPFGPRASVSSSQAPSYSGIYYGFGATIAVDPAVTSSSGSGSGSGSTTPSGSTGSSTPGAGGSSSSSSSSTPSTVSGSGSSSSASPERVAAAASTAAVTTPATLLINTDTARTSQVFQPVAAPQADPAAEPPVSVQQDTLPVNPAVVGSAVRPSADAVAAAAPASAGAPGSVASPAASVAAPPAQSVTSQQAAQAFSGAEKAQATAVIDALVPERGAAQLTTPSVPELQQSLRDVTARVRGAGGSSGVEVGPNQGQRQSARPSTRSDQQNFLASAEVMVALSDAGQAARMLPFFNRSAYKPAIIHVRFTEAKERTVDPDSDAFLDVTLIPEQGDVVGKRVEINRQKFLDDLRQLYSQLSRQEDLQAANPASPARRLYQQIFGSLSADLNANKITTLLISADRGLQGIPFAALHDGHRYFGDSFAFSLTPSLALTSLAPPFSGDERLLAVGVSEFDGLAPLPLVPSELQRIGESEAKETALNKMFTPQLLLDRAADPRVTRVHVATHAEFLPGGPAKSKLYSGTTPISLSDFVKLRQARKDSPLDLISFSACRTALGDSDSEMGFAGLALQAGARSAVGTLWYVDDVATSAYFIQMYRYLDAGVPKAEALQLTRQAFSRGLVRLDGDQLIGPDEQVVLNGLTTSQQRRIDSGLSNPYFWAGIELMGSPW